MRSFAWTFAMGLLATGAVLAAPPGTARQAPSPTALLPFELRSIPSEHMLPTLQIGDRVGIDKAAYRGGKTPARGHVVIFRHPKSPRIMISRVIGLPGDTVEMRGGQLYLNGAAVERTKIREIAYLSNYRRIEATEYSEQLPGEKRPHRIHEWSETERLDETPVFKVPAGHFFMIGDSRDNSEDSRAPTGHRALAKKSPEAWPWAFPNLHAPASDDAMGFVPGSHLMGRATGIMFSLHNCDQAKAKEAGAECLPSGSGKAL